MKRFIFCFHPVPKSQSFAFQKKKFPTIPLASWLDHPNPATPFCVRKKIQAIPHFSHDLPIKRQIAPNLLLISPKPAAVSHPALAISSKTCPRRKPSQWPRRRAAGAGQRRGGRRRRRRWAPPRGFSSTRRCCTTWCGARSRPSSGGGTRSIRFVTGSVSPPPPPSPVLLPNSLLSERLY